MNQCHDIKQEYEAIQDLKREFVLTCANAGSVDILSKEQLNQLKKLKRGLEQKRDALKNKIETKGTRTWRKIYETIMDTVVKQDALDNVGHRVRDLVATSNFRTTLADNISSLLRGHSTDGESTWIAATTICAGFEMGLVTAEEKEKMQKEVDRSGFDNAFLTHIVTEAKEATASDGYRVWRAYTGIHAARGLDLYTNEIKIQELLEDKFLQRKLVDYIVSNLRENSLEGHHAEYAVLGLQAALSFGFLTRVDGIIIQELVERDQFQKVLTKYIAHDSMVGQNNYIGVRHSIRLLYALKDLIELSRKRPK